MTMIPSQQVMVTALAEALISCGTVHRDDLVSSLQRARKSFSAPEFSTDDLFPLDQLIAELSRGPLAVH